MDGDLKQARRLEDKGDLEVAITPVIANCLERREKGGCIEEADGRSEGICTSPALPALHALPYNPGHGLLAARTSPWKYASSHTTGCREQTGRKGNMGIDPWGGQSKATKRAVWSESIDGGGVFRLSSSPRIVMQGRRWQGKSGTHITAKIASGIHPRRATPATRTSCLPGNMAESARAIGLWETMRDRAATAAVLPTRGLSQLSRHIICPYASSAKKLVA